MNLNPLVYHYKSYSGCPLATMLSGTLAGIQRIFAIFSTIMILILIFDDVENAGEMIICTLAMLVMCAIIRRYKLVWSDRLAAKEARKNV